MLVKLSPGFSSSTQCTPSDLGDMLFPSWAGCHGRLSDLCLARSGSWAKFGHDCCDDGALFFGSYKDHIY